MFGKHKLEVEGTFDNVEVKSWKRGAEFKCFGKKCRIAVELKGNLKYSSKKQLDLGYDEVVDGTGKKLYVRNGLFVSTTKPYICDWHKIIFKMEDTNKDYAIYLVDEDETVMLHSENMNMNLSDRYMLNEKLNKNKIRAFCAEHNFTELGRVQGVGIKNLWLFKRRNELKR